MEVVRDVGTWRWGDGAKMDWDVESDSGPVAITGLDGVLVLAHGVDLDIGRVLAN